MGTFEPPPKSLTPRRWRNGVVLSIAAMSVAGIVVIVYLGMRSRTAKREVAFRDGGLVARCARDADVLDQVSRFALSALYPDTDHFLGKEPRLFEPEILQAVGEAKKTASNSAETLPASMPKSADAAREMYITAAQEADFASEPRGNWLSFMSETTKSRSDFERAKLRYTSVRNRDLEWGYDEASVRSSVKVMTASVIEAARKQQERLAQERVERDAAREQAVAEAGRAASARDAANAGSCRITYLKWTDLTSLALVEGEILNTGPGPAQDVRVEVRYYDSAGTERTHFETVRGTIAPHEIQKFVTTISGINTRYRAQVAGGDHWESGVYHRLGY
jgi:hypothetical protein